MEGNGSCRVESKINGRSGVPGLGKEEGAWGSAFDVRNKNIVLGDKKNNNGTCSPYLPTLWTELL